jgi:peptidoglycan/LPS O-acetylase OafA/YrhL
VPLFFVLSAFSLAYSYNKSAQQSGWALPYLIKRLFRIAPLFYAMMVVWLYWYWPKQSAASLLANIVFVYNFVPGMHDSYVWAGWSIGVEMPFYLCLPFVLARVRCPLHAVIFLIGTGVISTSSRLWFAGGYSAMAFSSNIAIFAIGLLAYQCFASWPKAEKTWTLVGIVATAWLALISLRGSLIPTGPVEPLLWSCAFGLLCAWQAAHPSRWLSHDAMQWMGERSFSIYLLHPFVIFLLIRHGVYDAIWQRLEPHIGSWAYLVLVALAFAIVLPAAGVSYQLIERPGQKFGAMIFTMLLKPRLISRAVQAAPCARSSALPLMPASRGASRHPHLT